MSNPDVMRRPKTMLECAKIFRLIERQNCGLSVCEEGFVVFSRNFLILSVMAVLFVLAAGSVASASTESVGVIDMYEVTNNHPKMNDAKTQLATISRQKENEAKAAADKESDPAKKAQIVQTKRMELAQEEQKIMEPIFKDCQQAVRQVAVNKKLTLVLNKSVVLIGGSDITQDVIQQLAKGSASAPKKK